MHKATRFILAAMTVLALGIGIGTLAFAEPAAKADAKLTPPTEAEITAARDAGTQQATFTTTRGVIIAELYGKDAPLTVANFVKLANAKFYDGLTFHRVETNPHFSLIQGGDPAGNGTGGPGYAIKLEISPNLRHDAGALAMARAMDPDSAGSQFYIGAIPLHMLDDNYAVFGKVVLGLDVVKKIKVGDKITNLVIGPVKQEEVKEAVQDKANK